MEFDNQRTSLKYWMLGKEYLKAVCAMEFASKYHTGTRKDGITPEFHHQISIAHYLRTLNGLKQQQDVLSAAFLHDVVEDYNVSVFEIESRFGKDVSNAVVILSKNYNGRQKTMSEYYSEMVRCPIASIVKGADRIHNHQTMNSGNFSISKQIQYISETRQLILPMLEEAAKIYPEQDLAYENIKFTLRSQIELVGLAISGSVVQEK